MINMLNEQNYKQTTALPENPVPAMAYIPFQQWDDTYEVSTGYNAGTIFPVLNKPFYGRKEDMR